MNTTFAQLTVRNSAYVYVTDEVVFVEDDVSLKEAASMFYLRDDAQLIQGTGATGNSGVGQLSVFQSGTVDNFAYNYWCSPVGNTDVDAFGNSEYRGNNNMYDWTGSGTPALHQITSTAAVFTNGLNGLPRSGPTPITISARWLYSYNPGTVYADWDHIGSTNNLDAGYGFSMKGITGSTSQLYDFRGKPNSGDISTAVANGQTTLVGNPYPSALDTVDYLHDATNSTLLNGSLYFWEHDLSVNSHNVADYIGGYASYTINAAGTVDTFIDAKFDTYNSDGTFNTSGADSTTGKFVERYIPIGQGFMVEGVGNGNIFTRNSHREYYSEAGAESVFFRNGSDKSSGDKEKVTRMRRNEDGYKIVPDDYKRFRLNIDFNDTYTIRLIQNFHESATDGFDYGLEIKQAADEKSEVYFKNVGDDAEILAQANQFDRDLRIPLYIELTEQKSIRIRIADVQNFDDNQEIFLHDISNDFYYDLREVNFEAVVDAGLNDSEYEITFRNFSIPDTVDIGVDNFTIIQNNNTSNLVILNPNSIQVKELSVYDILGKRVLNSKNLNTESLRYEFPTNNLSEGTYIVKVNVAENNKVINKKIVVRNKK